MRILISNDDGYDSPGISALAAVARGISGDVWIVAPESRRTAGSHALTLGKPLRLTELTSQTFACSGTPADCIALAMTYLFKEGGAPDLVLSGINDSRNVGEDLVYSGTIAIAREAAFWGIPAIAFSQDRGEETDAAGSTWLRRVIADLVAKAETWWRPGHWISINLPSRIPAKIVPVARVGSNKIGTTCMLVEKTASSTTLVMPRGRKRLTEPDDENDLLSRGYATFALQHWRATIVAGDRVAEVLARVP